MLQLLLAWKLWSIEWSIQFQFLVVNIVAAISVLISPQLCSWLRFCGEKSCRRQELKNELKRQWGFNNNRLELRVLSSLEFCQCLLYTPNLHLKVGEGLSTMATAWLTRRSLRLVRSFCLELFFEPT